MPCRWLSLVLSFASKESTTPFGAAAPPSAPESARQAPPGARGMRLRAHQRAFLSPLWNTRVSKVGEKPIRRQVPIRADAAHQAPRRFFGKVGLHRCLQGAFRSHPHPFGPSRHVHLPSRQKIGACGRTKGIFFPLLETFGYRSCRETHRGKNSNPRRSRPVKPSLTKNHPAGKLTFPPGDNDISKNQPFTAPAITPDTMCF